MPGVCAGVSGVTSGRYFAALSDGEVPLEFLFSGTVFFSGPQGMLQTARISLDHEVAYRLPVDVWREAIERHFPQSAWLRLGREHFDRLCTFRARRGLPTWDAALDALLEGREEL